MIRVPEGTNVFIENWHKYLELGMGDFDRHGDLNRNEPRFRPEIIHQEWFSKVEHLTITVPFDLNTDDLGMEVQTRAGIVPRFRRLQTLTVLTAYGEEISEWENSVYDRGGIEERLESLHFASQQAMMNFRLQWL